MEIVRASILCRISTEAQDSAAQTKQLVDLATAKGYTVDLDDIYEDIISGYSKYETRPALTRLLDNIKMGRKIYNMCFVWDISRISRSVMEGQKILQQFHDLKVPLFIKTLMICSHEGGKQTMTFSIVSNALANMADYEAESMKLRFARGREFKIKNGGAGQGVLLPYGYTRDRNTKQLTIDLEECVIIQKIYDLASNGYGTRTICKILNEEKIQTKTQRVIKKGTIKMKNGFSKSTEHIKWEEGTLHSILKNPIYKGIRATKYGDVACISIIDPALWDKVQLIRTQKFNKRAREQRYMYLLTGLCICAKCGRNYYGRYRLNGTDMYYQCSSARTKSCENRGVNIEALESVIWDVVKEHPKHFEQFQQSDTQVQLREKIQLHQVQIIQIERDIKNFYKRKLKTIELFQSDIIPMDGAGGLKNRTTIIDKQIIALENRLQLTKKQMGAVSNLMKRISNYDQFNEHIQGAQSDRYLMAEVINNVVDKILIRSVSNLHNNYIYIIAVYIKDLPDPLCLALETKQRNQHADTFMQPWAAEWAGQNRFMYNQAGQLDESYIQFDNSGILVTDVMEAYTMIIADDDADISKGDTGFIDYTVPKLVRFQESNNKKGVDKIKLRQKVALE